MSTWRVEINFDAVSFTGQADGTLFRPTTAGRALVVKDGTGIRYALRDYLLPVVDPLTFIQTWQSNIDGAVFVGFNPATNEQDDIQDPFAWNGGGIFGGPAAGPLQASGTANFLTSGQIAIEKDFAGDQLRFITPSGTVSCSLSGLSTFNISGALNDTPLLPDELAHNLDTGAANLGINADEVSKWYNLAIKKNGVTQFSSPMSAASPIQFDLSFFDLGGGRNPSNFAIPEDNAQETTRYRTRTVYTTPGTNVQRYTTWNDPFKNTQFTVPNVDSCIVPEHAMVLSVDCDVTSCLCLFASHDDNTSMARTMITPVTVCNSPSVQWLAGTITVVYHDGTNIKQTQSSDQGLTWSAPVSVSITATNPRLVIGRDGTYFYFCIDSGPDLRLYRSFDFGSTLVDAAPGILVAASVTVQDFGAVFAADGSLLVIYGAAGVLVTRISQDFGQSWSTV